MSIKKKGFLFLKNPFFLGIIFGSLFYFYCFLSTKANPSFFSSPRFNDFFLSSNQIFKKETLKKSLCLNILQANTLASFSFVSPLFLETRAQEENLNIGNGLAKEPIEYVVKKGDTIALLAKRFNISEETILWANDLQKGEKLKEGQVLLILPVSGVVHIVEKGQTIAEIAKKYRADPQKIIAFNEIEGEKIYKGDVLVIPDGVMPSLPKEKKESIPSKLVYLPEIPSSYFILPTNGIVSQGLHWYNAVDIANRCDITPIVASAEGVVIQAGWSGACGKTIKIEHPNGLVSVYCHLSSFFVQEGDYVAQGQEIGRIGNTGRTHGLTGCHLHFSVIGAKNPLAGYRKGTPLGF